MDTMWGFHAPLGNVLGKVVGMAKGWWGRGWDCGLSGFIVSYDITSVPLNT